jgi:hypothetical protein
LRRDVEGVGDWQPRERAPERRSLLPTILWGAGALLAAVPLVAVLITALTQPLPGTRWSLIGVILLLSVIELALAVMALQAFLNWKDPD